MAEKSERIMARGSPSSGARGGPACWLTARVRLSDGLARPWAASESEAAQRAVVGIVVGGVVVAVRDAVDAAEAVLLAPASAP